MDPLSRFMTKINKTETCWIWTGTRNTRTGRAYFKVGHSNQIAARWLWSRLHGEAPQGLVVMHKCDNPACVNPEHLLLGTQKENVADRDAKGRNRLRASHCKNGHPLFGDNVRLWGPDGRWRACRSCLRDAQRRYITREEAEAH